MYYINRQTIKQLLNSAIAKYRRPYQWLKDQLFASAFGMANNSSARNW